MKKHSFPLDFLAVEVKAVLEHFSLTTKSPLNYVAASAFTAIGAAAGKRLEVIDGAYRNYGQLYTCLVGVPGSSKSPAMEVALGPLKDADEVAYSDYTKQKKEFRRKQKKGDDGVIEPPVLKKVITSDATFEKLASMMSENNGSMLIHADELTGFLLNLDRYSNGSNMPKLLEMWTNNNVTIDRKGDDSLLISRPFLGILGSTQPANLPLLFERFKGSGFFPRWSFVLPDTKPETRIEPEMTYYAYWEKVIRKVLEIENIKLYFSDDIKPLLACFDDEREAKTEYFAETNPEMAETYAKSSYKIRRIAGIVHLLSEDNCIANKTPTNIISPQEFFYAERIVSFFEKCSLEVLNMMTEKKYDRLTDKQILFEFNKRFHPTRISELARNIGKSKQYVSRCFMGGDTTEIERKEKTIKDITENLREIIETTSPNAWNIIGCPSDDEIGTIYETCDGDVREIIRRLKKLDSLNLCTGMSYSLLISQLGNSS